MTLIAKNNSGSTQKYLSLVHENGVNVPISDYYSQFDISTSSELNALIIAGDIVLNDGTDDLSISDALNATEIGVFNYENAFGITQGTGGTLIHTLTGTTDDFNPTDFLTYNYFIFDMSSDRDFTGWEAPPSGVERIIRGINKSDKKINFKDNDPGSVAANRLSLKEYGTRDCKKGECFAFRYVESELRWWPENRIG